MSRSDRLDGSGGTSESTGLMAFAARGFVIGPGGEIIAVVHWRDSGWQRQNFEAVAREFEVADDLGAQQADDVAEFGETIAGEDFFGDGRTADDFAAFEHHHFFLGASKVCSRDKPVVPGADDDCVV